MLTTNVDTNGMWEINTFANKDCVNCVWMIAKGYNVIRYINVVHITTDDKMLIRIPTKRLAINIFLYLIILSNVTIIA